MPKGLKHTQKQNYSFWLAYEKQASSRENGEGNEEDSRCEPKSDYDSESDNSKDDDDEDNSPPCLQEVLDESESGSNDEESDEFFDSIPDFQVKKRREVVLECSDSDSEFDKESDTEQQLLTSSRKIVRLASELEASIDIYTHKE